MASIPLSATLGDTRWELVIRLAASKCISVRRDFKLYQSEHVGKLSIKGKNIKMEFTETKV
jgi:hypothetical protein